MTELLTADLTQLALAFFTGTVVAVAVAAGLGRLRARLPLERVERVLDVMDEHKDDVIMMSGTLAMIGRSVVMPHAQWIDVVATGQLTWLVLAAGAGLGLSRAGQALKKNVGASGGAASSPTSNTSSDTR